MSIRWALRNRIMAGADRRRREGFQRDALLAVAHFPFPMPVRKPGLDRPVVVSLTSYPPRFDTLALTLKSLLTQETAPDRIVLWLTPGDKAKLPSQVLALEDLIEVRTCEDTRSYKKILPSLAAFPNAHIVTVDDDVFYSSDWLRSLVDAHRVHPGAVVCRRAHMIRFKADGSIRRYNDWEYETTAEVSRGSDGALFPTGVGGIFYPSGAFPPEATDLSLIRELCPNADDIWFFWMARRAGLAHARAPGRFEIAEWPGSQIVSLQSANVAAKGNDLQLRAMERAFGCIAAPR